MPNRGGAMDLIRELFTRQPTRANELASETKTDLEIAKDRHCAAVLKFARVVREKLTEQDQSGEPEKG